jgi:hypothetical protein
VQNPQPLIWLARSRTSSRVEAGSDDPEVARPAEMMCFMNLAATGLVKRFKRASMVANSCAVVVGYTSKTAQLARM